MAMRLLSAVFQKCFRVSTNDHMAPRFVNEREAVDLMVGDRIARRERWIVVLVWLTVGIAVMRPADAQEQVEKTVWGAFTFGKAHGMMRNLEGTLKELLAAFLAGDPSGISQQADVIVADMAELPQAFPESPEGDRQLWKVAWEISKDARMMQSAIHRSDYREAYGQFTRLTNRCMQCHQDRRVWGRFSVTAPAGDSSKTSPSR